MTMLAETGGLTLPDYAVIAVYLIGTLAMGGVIGMRMKTGTDFFLAGRRLPWWAIGMSLVATDIGGTDIIGVGGAAYSYGMAVANFEWIGCVPAMIVGAFVFIPFFYRTGVTTIPEYFERRFNSGVRTVMAVCWLLFMACNLGIMLLASAKMMSTVFGWNATACIIVTAVLVGGYTLVGGLEAVVYTDMIQCIVMIAGCLLILVLGLIEVGGISELRSRIATVESQAARSNPNNAIDPDSSVSAERTSLILPAETESPFPWTGIYFGLALILSPAYWIGNQAIVQRSLGARSEFEAKASYVWGALLKNVIPLIVAIPGIIAIALLPDLPDGDAAIPSLVNLLLPAGLRGLFVAAFLAALMSSIDSYLNSAATIASNDLYKRFSKQEITDAELLKVGRTTTLGLIVTAVVIAFALMMLNEKSGIYAIFQTLMAFFQGPALAILLLGVFWRRANGRSALIGLLCGIGTSISLYALNQPVVYGWLGWEPLFKIQEPFLYFSIWAFIVTMVVVVVLSLCSRPDADEKLRFVLGSRPEPVSANPDPPTFLGETQ